MTKEVERQNGVPAQAPLCLFCAKLTRNNYQKPLTKKEVIVTEDSILKPQVSVPADNEDMTKKQRENIIKKHMEHYTTKYYESDNRWHSFLPDENHARKMKPIAKRNREDLENVIVDYYLQQEQSEKRKRMTLRTLYPEWFAYKWQDTNNSSYMNHINYDWKRFYENDSIIDRPIVELTSLELKSLASYLPIPFLPSKSIRRYLPRLWRKKPNMRSLARLRSNR